MLSRLHNACLVRPSDVAPSSDELKVVGTFNPGAIECDGEVVLLVRVVEAPRETRAGYTGLPRWDGDGRVVIDWTPNDELEPIDVRIVRRRADGNMRLTFTSHLRVMRGVDTERLTSTDGARFLPAGPYESYGVEDPRITQIDDRYCFTYVAVSEHGAATALASTSDFVTFERHGIIFCPENKDVVLFPQRIDGQYVALHRPNPAARFSPAEMWIARSPDLVHWGEHEQFLDAAASWQTGRIGGGTPPIRTDEGWLTLYHGNVKPKRSGDVGVYSAGALLLDLDDPRKILRATREPIMVPDASFDREGFVPNVVFPTGIVERGDRYLVYYGAADEVTAVAELAKADVMGALQPV